MAVEYNGLRYILRKVFSSLAFRTIGLVSGFVFTWLVAQGFGLTALGVYSINIAVLYITIIPLKLGLDTHVVAEIAQLNRGTERLLVNAYYRKVLLLYLITAVLGSCMLYFTARLLGGWLNLKEGENHIRTVSFFLFPLMLIHLNAAVMRAHKRVMSFSFFLNGGVSFVAVMIVFLFFSQNERLEIPLYSQLASMIILCFISILMTFRLVNPFDKSKPYAKTNRQIISESLPMMVTSASHPMWNWGGIFILGFFNSTSVVGVFQLLLRCSNIIGLPIRAISTIMAPIFSEEKLNDKKRDLGDLIKRTSILSFLLSLPIILLTVFFSKTIMGVFGTELVIYWGLLVIICSAKFVNACFGPIGITLLMTGRQGLRGKMSVVELIIYLILTVLLTKFYGLTGASVALLIALIFRNFMVAFYINRIFGVYPLALLHLIPALKDFLRKKNA